MRQSATQVTQRRREDTLLADARSRLVAGGRRRTALAGARLVGTQILPRCTEIRLYVREGTRRGEGGWDHGIQ